MLRTERARKLNELQRILNSAYPPEYRTTTAELTSLTAARDKTHRSAEKMKSPSTLQAR